MRMIADFMLIAGAVGAAAYCYILSQRLRRLTDLEGGIGQVIATLALQVAELSRKTDEARAAAQGSTAHLENASQRAEATVRRLEMLMASMDDTPRSERPAAKHQAPRAAPPMAKSSSGPAATRDSQRERVG